MAEDSVTTYPADAMQRVADRLQDMDSGLDTDEAEMIAFDIVTDVTMAVDKLRRQEYIEALDKAMNGLVNTIKKVQDER